VFGTTWAYVIPASLPKKFNLSHFKEKIRLAAKSLRLKRAICMLDFIVSDTEPVFLELSPRPGGDCLPDLMLWCGSFDIIGFTLNFADHLAYGVPDYRTWSTYVGLRLYADRGGKIAKLSHRSIARDRRVKEVKLKYGVGHRVVMPPYDYDSRILGHVIFRPDDISALSMECDDISGKLEVEMEREFCIAPKAS
jgi:hypothetical protein